MNEIIYLEPDDDITGVLSRIKKLGGGAVALVIPRGGTIGQSVINLKLLKRESEKNGVVISLVTKDKISKNLATQLGLNVYSTASEAKTAKVSTIGRVPVESATDQIGDIKVNRYQKEDELLAESDEETDEEELDVEREDPDSEDEVIKTREVEEKEEEEDLETKKGRYDVDREELRTREESQVTKNKGEAEKKPEDDDEKTKMRHKNLSSRRKPLLIILGVFLFLLVVLAAVLLPSAEAKVILSVSDYEKDYKVVLSADVKSADIGKLELPAVAALADREDSKEFSATGSKNVGTKAGGEITFYNDYDPSNSVKIAAGTILTASGKQFVVNSTVTIPPATVISLYPPETNPGTIKGKITAKEAGEEYNIGASVFLVSGFSGVKLDKVYGKSTSALTGGTTEIVKFVTENDIAEAKKELSEEVSGALRTEIEKVVLDNSGKMIDSSYKEEETSSTSTKAALDEAERFSITIKKNATAYYFSEQVLRESVLRKAEIDLGEGAMVVDPDKSKFSYDIKSVSKDGRIINLDAKFTGKSGKKLSEEQIRSVLHGTKLGMAKEKVEAIDGVNSAEITVKPNFWPMIPFLERKISVNFSYNE